MFHIEYMKFNAHKKWRKENEKINIYEKVLTNLIEPSFKA